MTRAQNSPRGLFQKNAIKIGDQMLTANSTAAIFDGAVKIATNGQVNFNGTADAFVFTGTSALPGAVSGIAGLAFIDNSTGQSIVVNTTGTTWKYLNVTTVQPT